MMKDRILEFLKNENKSSAQLAEEIGVQASGISHILSGRNNPSLDFVLKMLEKYQFLSTDWLLFGKGSMYKDVKMQNLFDVDSGIYNEIQIKQVKNEPVKEENEITGNRKIETKREIDNSEKKTTPEIVRIVWFYENNHFEEFSPRG
jgi:transcriptional regulator with XRE-family HTH domain